MVKIRGLEPETFYIKPDDKRRKKSCTCNAKKFSEREKGILEARLKEIDNTFMEAIKTYKEDDTFPFTTYVWIPDERYETEELGTAFYNIPVDSDDSFNYYIEKIKKVYYSFFCLHAIKENGSFLSIEPLDDNTIMVKVSQDINLEFYFKDTVNLAAITYENDTDYIINILIRELECQILDLKSELACMESYAEVHKKEVKKYLKKKKKDNGEGSDLSTILPITGAVLAILSPLLVVIVSSFIIPHNTPDTQTPVAIEQQVENNIENDIEPDDTAVNTDNVIDKDIDEEPAENEVFSTKDASNAPLNLISVVCSILKICGLIMITSGVFRFINAIRFEDSDMQASGVSSIIIIVGAAITLISFVIPMMIKMTP